jgi:hypothetical protein
MTYPDCDLGLMSAVAGLWRPMIGCAKHYFMVPANPQRLKKVSALHPRNRKPYATKYADHDALVSLFGTLPLRKDAYITLYLDTLVNAAYIGLMDLATRLAANQGAAGALLYSSTMRKFWGSMVRTALAYGDCRSGQTITNAVSSHTCERIFLLCIRSTGRLHGRRRCDN